ncbi:MAG: tail fiber domain-containing protein [Bacteroidia bacterium]
MKNLLPLAGLIFLAILCPYSLFSQARGISYQAVARDVNGALMPNQALNVSFLIREGAASGPVVYDESHTPTTNDFSLFSLVIGEGNPVIGDFSTIDWSAHDYYLEVEIGGASVGVNRFNAVPYSQVARLATEMEMGHLNDVDTAGLAAGQVLKYDGSRWVAGSDSTGPWTSVGNDLFYSGGRVGIGTAPTVGLHVEIPGQDNDILIADDNAFLRINTTSSSGNGGIAFYDQGNYSGWISHRGTSDALVLSGEASSIARPNLVIANNGRIGIGTYTPSYPLHMTKDTLSINGLEIANLGSANLGLDGDLVPYGGSGLAYDLGNNTSTEHWDDVVAADYITYSDQRLKSQITALPAGLAEVLKLKPVQYRYVPEVTPDNRLRYGLLAQDVEKIFPNMVIEEDVDVNPETGLVERKKQEYKSMTYTDLIPVLIQAIQDQQQHIQLLEGRIEQLETALKKQ